MPLAAHAPVRRELGTPVSGEPRWRLTSMPERHRCDILGFGRREVRCEVAVCYLDLVQLH